MPNEILEAEKQRLGRIRGWVNWIFRAFATLVLLVGFIGATYQAVAEHRDRQRFPMPGKLVDVGGFRLHLDCTGSGSPAVILESGLGVPAAGWALVQPQVAIFTRVCSYDRAGYGWSDPGPSPRTSREVARELHTLLGRAGVAPPYILVGHSFGGFNARVYNGLFPGEISGMVFVDSSQEDMDSRMPASLRDAAAKELRQLQRTRLLFPFLLTLGIVRAIAEVENRPLALPAALKEELVYLQLQPKYLDAILGEERAFPQSTEEVRASGSLGEMPLVVLTAGKTTLAPGESNPDFAAFHDIWMKELQPRLARLSTRGRQVIVPNSDHMIPFEQPQAVVGAIREVRDEAARK